MSQEGAGNGIAFAFSGASKKQTRKLDLHERADDHKKDVLTGVGPDGGLQSAQPIAHVPDGPKIIPKQANTYRTPGRQNFVPSFIPDAADDQIQTQGIDNFQAAEHDTAVAQKEVTYGLIKRNKAQETTTEAAPPTNKNVYQPSKNDKKSDAELLQKELEDLPPEASLEAYEEMPVDAFGEALLRGMGWSEGRAIGRGNKKEVETKSVVRRPHRLGLGATPAPIPDTKKKLIKPGESRSNPNDLVYVDPATGVLKASQQDGKNGQNGDGSGVRPGKVMAIIAGRHEGLKCEVQSLEPQQSGRPERAKVRLLPSYEIISLRCGDLGEDEGVSTKNKNRTSSGEERVTGEKRREYDAREDSGDKRRKKERAAVDRKKEKKERVEEEEGPSWLVPNIRVKIIDKRLHGGKYYLKKGVVIDVKTPTLCDVFLDDIKQTVTDVKQSQLETVVPSVEGTPVQVLLGKFSGKRGRLLQRNTTTGLAAVHFTSDLGVHKLSLDDIAEYCGPSDGLDD